MKSTSPHLTSVGSHLNPNILSSYFESTSPYLMSAGSRSSPHLNFNSLSSFLGCEYELTKSHLNLGGGHLSCCKGLSGFKLELSSLPYNLSHYFKPRGFQVHNLNPSGAHIKTLSNNGLGFDGLSLDWLNSEVKK